MLQIGNGHPISPICPFFFIVNDFVSGDSIRPFGLWVSLFWGRGHSMSLDFRMALRLDSDAGLNASQTAALSAGAASNPTHGVLVA
jgi:hypothetical protein